MNVIELTQQTFDAALAEHPFLLIDFWAPWCAPCKGFTEVVKKVAEDYSDVVFAKVNIDEEKALADEFQIRSIPAVMLIRHQTVVYAESGSLSDGQLRELLDKARDLTVEDVKH